MLFEWLWDRARATIRRVFLALGLEVQKSKGRIPSFRNWLEERVEAIVLTPSQDVLEIGPGHWSIPRGHAIAAGANYVSVDPNADCEPTLVGTYKDISQFGIQFDTIFLFETLEHVATTSEVLDTVFANLKPGGRLFGSVPFKKNLHGEEYGDYYRFTRQGLRFVMRRFATLRIESLGDDDFPRAYFWEATKAI